MIFVGICLFTCYKKVACGDMSVFGDPEVSNCVAGNNKNVIITLRSECWAILAIDTEWHKVKNRASENWCLQNWQGNQKLNEKTI